MDDAVETQAGDAIKRPRVTRSDGDKLCGFPLKQRPGLRCRKPSGAGTTHLGYGYCRTHEKNNPNLMKPAMREMARSMVITYGLPRDVDPHTALLEQVRASAGHVQWLALKIQSFEAEQLTWGMVSEELVRERVAQQASGENGGLEIVPGTRDELEKVIRRRISMAAGASVWLKQYNEERDRLVHFCAVAIKCGVRERQVKVYEDIARLFAAGFVRSLTALGVDPYTEQSRAVLREQLLLLAAGGEVIDVTP